MSYRAENFASFTEVLIATIDIREKLLCIICLKHFAHSLQSIGAIREERYIAIFLLNLPSFSV